MTSSTPGVARLIMWVPILAMVVAGAPFTLPRAALAAPDDLAPVMLVLDASGSMKERAGTGDKMAAAKAAVHTLLGQAPEGAQIGLTVYGSGTGNSPADKAAGCKDVKVVHEVGPLNRPALTASVDAVQPRGYTPIGQSLQVAAAALPANGKRSIVLISDGEDTCAPPDPCEVARVLRANGADLRVHAVGFDVDGKARQQLACLAQATGGTYVDAADAAGLSSALNRITQQALRFYQPVGTPVTGTRAPDGAPRLQPGTYLDRIMTGESRYYSVDVPAGYTLYATGTAVVPTGNEYFVHVDRYDGKVCTGRASSGATDAALPAISASLQWTAPPAASPGSTPCASAGAQFVQVSLEPVFAGRAGLEAAVEVLIGLEPPLTGDAGPPGTADRVAFDTPPASPRPVVGGASFSTAAALDGRGSYTDTVIEGEMVFYRVRLDWGQGLAYRLRLGEQEYTGSGGGFIVKTFWYNPTRSLQDSQFGSYKGPALTVPEAPDTLAGPPVRYRNRELDANAREVSVAGWYYIAVRAERDISEEAVTLQLTLDLSVNGTPQPGPGYVGNAGMDPFGERATAAQPSSGPRAGLWSRMADAGPALWLGLPLLVLLIGGGALTVLYFARAARSTPRQPPRA